MLAAPDFHHQHLNSVAPDAAIDFYVKPPAVPDRPSRGPRPRATPETPPYPLLRGLSRLRCAALHRAASRCGRQPLGAGDAANAASQAPAGDAGMAHGRFPGCAPEGRPLKYRLFYLSANLPRGIVLTRCRVR